jgi:thioester reductase-like protein
VRLVLSARTRAELDVMSKNLATAMAGATLPAADVAHTLRVGRKEFVERRVVSATPDKLPAALRLPRPPSARTVRAEPGRRVVVVTGGEVPQRLSAAFGPGLEVLAEDRAPADRFRVLVGGTGKSTPDTAVLAADAGADELDEAICMAWASGVAVDWEALAAGAGHRLSLPAYPLPRKRYWALDRLASLTAPAPEDGKPATPRTSTEPAGSVEAELAGIWRDLFGGAEIGVDDEFGALGGTSLQSVQMALEIQRRTGVLVNVHRAGGSKATIRRIAEIVNGRQAGLQRGAEEIDPIADGDGELVDRDIELPLGELSASEAPGSDVLLTGPTGYLGAFLLHELLQVTEGRVYCVVRAADEAEGRRRLRETAAKFELPEPDPRRVHLVLGDLSDVGTLLESYRDGELASRIGHVLHCAAKVVFTEPYRVLRKDNVLSTVDLLRWMRGHGIRDFGFVSTVAATHYALGTDHRILETREQPLDPLQGGYGVGKWVCERILERAEQDGMRIRVFRPGFIIGSTKSGACNDKDLIWNVLTSGLAVGAHPLDDRAMPLAPVDLVARAMAELTVSPGSVGRVYHLVDRLAHSPRRMFRMLAEAGWHTEAVSPEQWQQRVADKALATGSGLLSTMALYELDGHELADDGLEAVAWRPWLERAGLDSAPTGELLRRCLTFLAERHEKFGALLTDYVAPGNRDVHDLVEVR